MSFGRPFGADLAWMQPPLSGTPRVALLALGLLAWLGGAALPDEGTMTRDAANRLVKAYAGAHGVKSIGLNDKDLGGLDSFGQALYFEYLPDPRRLRANALVYRFHKPPRPGVIEGFQKEAANGTDAGGGTPEYQAESRGLFLVRSYAGPVPEKQFVKEIDRLAAVSQRWRGEVLPRVAGQVFHPEEKK